MSVRTDRRKERRRTAMAVAISLLIHLIILVAAAIILSLRPERPPRSFERKPEPPPVKVTILPAPTPTPPPQEKRFFDSAEGETAEKPPENVAFESDRNTKAASELSGTSNAPVPTTRGEDATGLTLTARDLSLGPAVQPAPASPASPPRPKPVPQEMPEPTPTPEEKPTPEPTPQPTATPKPTPKPTPKSTPPPEAELAMLDPLRPKPTPKPQREKPQPTPVEQMPPSRPQTPGFQPQTRVTRLVGGISTKGRASIGAEASPLGRYKKQISDAIGSRWYYYVSDMLDLVSVGTVQLTFVVSKTGKVTNVRVVRNTSNESLASCSVRSIIEAEIPPMPKDVVNAVAGERIEVDFTFSIVGQ